MIESKVEEVASYFENGFACSQAVFTPHAESLGVKPEIALPLAESFGAGMGGMAETCGAVTGAFMVIGLMYGRTTVEDIKAKEKTRALIKTFVKQFKENHGAIECKHLLGEDISTTAGMKAAEEKGLFKTYCPKFVRDAALILENVIE